MTFETALLAGMGVLGAAIGVLFKMLVANQREMQVMSRDLGKLQGQQDGVKQLAEQVLKVVAESCQKK